MLNSYSVKGGNYSNTTKINAVSGTLVKNHPNSFFKRFALQSEYAGYVLSDTPHIKEKKYDSSVRGHRRDNSYWVDIPVVVLQIMVVGDMEVVAEIVKKDEYDYAEEVEE